MMTTYACTGYDDDGMPVYENQETGEEVTPEELIDKGAIAPLGDKVEIE